MQKFNEFNRDPNAGFTLVETVFAGMVAVIALLSLAGVMIAASHQREQADSQRTMLARARSVMEEIRGTTPASIPAAYGGKTYPVSGLAGDSSGSAALSVSVDFSNPKLLEVTIVGTWTAAGNEDSFTLGTKVYNPSG